MAAGGPEAYWRTARSTVPPTVADKLRSITGAPHVLTGVECSPYVLEGRTPEAVVFPGSKDEVAAVLGVAAEAEIPVIPWGGGTRLALGSPPPRLGLVIGLKRLNRVLEHVPGDLTATVEAGITLGALQLDARRAGPVALPRPALCRAHHPRWRPLRAMPPARAVTSTVPAAICSSVSPWSAPTGRSCTAAARS